MLVHNYFKAHSILHVTIQRDRLLVGIDGDKMNEAVLESSEKPVLDLNEKIRVLLVDDDCSLLKIAKQCLEIEAPLQVDTSPSVEEAFKKLEKGKYDVIISDYQMPMKDGLEFLKELREKDNKIPFIMFTGKGREEVAIKALNLGANQYVNKVGETETVYTELAHSITELAKIRKAEEKQCESEEKFRNLFEKANDGLVFIDVSGRIVDVNQKAAEMAEKRKEDIVGRPFFDLGLVSSKNLPVLVEKLRAQSTGKPTERFEFEIEKENGEKRLIEINSAIIRENNVPTGSLAIVRDVTERKRTEEALRKSEAELRAQFYGSPDLIMILDRKHRYVRINRTHFLSYDVTELIGKDAIEPLPPDQRDLARTNVDQCFATGSIQEFEHNLSNGERIHARVVPLQSAGTVDQVMIISTDITERKKTERDLDRFSSAVKASLDGIITGDLNGNIVDANEAAIKMYGSNDKRDLIGKNVQDLLVERDRTRAQQNAIETAQTGQGKTVEYTVLTKNGIEVPMEITTQLLVDERGEPTGFVDIIRDLTERKKAEGALRESEERYSRLSAAAFEGIGIDERGKIADANDQLAKMLGYEPSELIGKAVLDFVAPESRDFVMANMREGFEGPYEHLAKKKGGSVFPVEIRTRLIQYRGHTARVCAIRDITDRKRAEEALRVSEERYRNLTEELQRFSTAVKASVDGVVVSDMEGRIVEVNDAALKLYGANEKKDLTGKNFLELVVPEEREKLIKNMKETVAKGCVGAKEINAINVKGERIPVESTTTLIRDAKGQAVSFLSIIRDLTDRKSQHRLLEESQQKFAGLFSGNPEATAYVDRDMCILDVNPRFESLFGYSLDDIRGKHIDDLVVPGNLLEEGKRLNEKAAEGYVYHDTLRKMKDGSSIPVSVSAAPIQVHDKLIGYVWIYKDISQQKTVEESLKESEERFRALFAGGPEASVYLSPDFHIQDINRRFEQLFGYSLAEIKGKRLDNVVVQEGKKEEATKLNEEAAGGYVYHETVRRRKNGSLVPVSISAAPIVIKGQLSGIVGTYKDISDLKSAEEKLAIMNEKLRVVGGLTRHDIRNKLSIVTGNTYLMKKRLKDHPEVMDGLEELEFACSTIVQLLEFARDYERLGVEELTYVDLEDSIQKAASLFADTDRPKIVNECHGLFVLADSLLSKLFYNLIDNSLKHGSYVTRISISCEEGVDELRVVYEDNGVGISQESKPKLFTEGYTMGKGSGYGLYLIRKMMEAYGWSIQETGLPGKGVRFIIAIPKLNKERKGNYRVRQP